MNLNSYCYSISVLDRILLLRTEQWNQMAFYAADHSFTVRHEFASSCYWCRQWNMMVWLLLTCWVFQLIPLFRSGLKQECMSPYSSAVIEGLRSSPVPSDICFKRVKGVVRAGLSRRLQHGLHGAAPQNQPRAALPQAGYFTAQPHLQNHSNVCEL